MKSVSYFLNVNFALRTPRVDISTEYSIRKEKVKLIEIGNDHGFREIVRVSVKPPGNIDAVLLIGGVREGIFTTGSTKDDHAADYENIFYYNRN